LNVDELKYILTTLIIGTNSEEKQGNEPKTESGDTLEEEGGKPPEMINRFSTSQHGEDLDLEVESIHVNQHPYNTRSKDMVKNHKTPSSSQTKDVVPKSKDIVSKQKDHTGEPKTADNSKKSSQISELDYDPIEDLKRIKENISIYELFKLPSIWQNILQNLSTVKNNSDLTTDIITAKSTNRNNSNKALTGKKSSPKSPPFLLTFEIFNQT